MVKDNRQKESHIIIANLYADLNCDAVFQYLRFEEECAR